jgi:hypothetical protein
MFLEQVAQKATTWSRTLQELANLKIKFEQSKKKLVWDPQCLQTYSLKLEIM